MSSCEQYSDSIGMMLYSLNHASSGKGKLNLNIGNVVGQSTKLKLPTVELPKFDGSPESYPEFIYTFEAILDKFILVSLSNILI